MTVFHISYHRLAWLTPRNNSEKGGKRRKLDVGTLLRFTRDFFLEGERPVLLSAILFVQHLQGFFGGSAVRPAKRKVLGTKPGKARVSGTLSGTRGERCS